ncbi:hypothetical protein GALL_464530 [mine drainage metagenome]|uniref:Uncharacterized protein n=1 Tax=mine drainage metagenome TaxID=410659 RepID=A0A1J5PK84_9ZZZZ
MPLGDPIDLEFAVAVGFLRDRIADEFQGLVAGHDHGAAGEEGIRGGDAAPEDAPVPDRRAFVGIELFADRGVDAVGGDQKRPVMAAGRLSGCLVDEFGAHAVRRLGPVAQMMAGENVFTAQAFGRGIEQDLLQHPAMDRELRPFVAGLDPARLAPDRLAVLGKIREFPGAHAGRVEPVEQAEFDQLANRVRQHVAAHRDRHVLHSGHGAQRGNDQLLQIGVQAACRVTEFDFEGHVTAVDAQVLDGLDCRQRLAGLRIFECLQCGLNRGVERLGHDGVENGFCD